MTLPLTDFQKINRRKCQTKGCPNKATGISKKKFLCKECKKKKNSNKRPYRARGRVYV